MPIDYYMNTGKGPIIVGPIGLLLVVGENCSDDDLPDVHDDTLFATLPNSTLSTFDN